MWTFQEKSLSLLIWRKRYNKKATQRVQKSENLLKNYTVYEYNSFARDSVTGNLIKWSRNSSDADTLLNPALNIYLSLAECIVTKTIIYFFFEVGRQICTDNNNKHHSAGTLYCRRLFFITNHPFSGRLMLFDTVTQQIRNIVAQSYQRNTVKLH